MSRGLGDVYKRQPVTHTMLEEDEAYERAYNLYGKVIFKDRRKALDKFKKIINRH